MLLRGGRGTCPQAEVSDPLWGAYIFKKGFGGRLVRMVGALDLVYRPLLYAWYRWPIFLVVFKTLRTVGH